MGGERSKVASLSDGVQRRGRSQRLRIKPHDRCPDQIGNPWDTFARSSVAGIGASETRWIHFRMSFVDILVPLQNSLDPSFPHYSLFQSSKSKLHFTASLLQIKTLPCLQQAPDPPQYHPFRARAPSSQTELRKSSDALTRVVESHSPDQNISTVMP